MRGESRTSFADLRDLLPEALAEARRAYRTQGRQ